MICNLRNFQEFILWNSDNFFALLFSLENTCNYAINFRISEDFSRGIFMVSGLWKLRIFFVWERRIFFSYGNWNISGNFRFVFVENLEFSRRKLFYLQGKIAFKGKGGKGLLIEL